MVARGFKELQRAEDARELASDRDRMEAKLEDMEAKLGRWQQRFDLNNDGKISYEELVDDMVAHPMRWGATTVIEELAVFATSD